MRKEKLDKIIKPFAIEVIRIAKQFNVEVIERDEVYRFIRGRWPTEDSATDTAIAFIENKRAKRERRRLFEECVQAVKAELATLSIETHGIGPFVNDRFPRCAASEIAAEYRLMVTSNREHREHERKYAEEHKRRRAVLNEERLANADRNGPDSDWESDDERIATLTFLSKWYEEIGHPRAGELHDRCATENYDLYFDRRFIVSRVLSGGREDLREITDERIVAEARYGDDWLGRCTVLIQRTPDGVVARFDDQYPLELKRKQEAQALQFMDDEVDHDEEETAP